MDDFPETSPRRVLPQRRLRELLREASGRPWALVKDPKRVFGLCSYGPSVREFPKVGGQFLVVGTIRLNPYF